MHTHERTGRPLSSEGLENTLGHILRPSIPSIHILVLDGNNRLEEEKSNVILGKIADNSVLLAKCLVLNEEEIRFQYRSSLVPNCLTLSQKDETSH